MMINELIERSHAMAVEKGWWDGGERSVADQVNNFHEEISEAWGEYRAGRMELWWHHPELGGVARTDAVASEDSVALSLAGNKPEGFWIEIADLCIRLADTMGAYGWPCQHDAEFVIAEGQTVELPRFVGTLHSAIASCYDCRQGLFTADGPQCFLETIIVCCEVARQNGIDLLSLCELKMSYNATRPHRNGGKRA
jgi:hypothetical protein